MKKDKWLFTALGGVLIALSIPLVGCGEGRSFKELMTIEGRMRSIEPPPATIADVKAAIAKYEKAAQKQVEDDSQRGYYYKLLGSLYLEKKMYGPALESFEAAVRIGPENPVLYYYQGLSSALVAKTEAVKAEPGPERAGELMASAERCYLRAVEIDPGYSRCNYALAVLYAFELSQPAKAEPYLQRYLDKNPSDTRALFIMARVQYAQGRTNEAGESYRQVIKRSKDEAEREEAKRNLEILGEGGDYDDGQ